MIADELSLYYICVGFFVTLIAYVVKGFTGFGSGIVMVSVLALMMDLKVVVFAACVCAVVNGAALAAHAWRDVAWRPIAGVFIGLVMGLVVGVRILATLSGHSLKMCFGALVCVFAVRMFWRQLRSREQDFRPWPEWVGPISGAVGGIILGVYGGGGPAMVVYLAHQLRRKEVLRGSLIVLFFVGDVLRLGGYVFEDMATRQSLALSCVTLPAALLGGYLGTRVQGRVNAATFRLFVAGLLLVTGALLLWSS